MYMYLTTCANQLMITEVFPDGCGHTVSVYISVNCTGHSTSIRPVHFV